MPFCPNRNRHSWNGFWIDAEESLTFISAPLVCCYNLEETWIFLRAESRFVWGDSLLLRSRSTLQWLTVFTVDAGKEVSWVSTSISSLSLLLIYTQAWGYYTVGLLWWIVPKLLIYCLSQCPFQKWPNLGN